MDGWMDGIESVWAGEVRWMGSWVALVLAIPDARYPLRLSTLRFLLASRWRLSLSSRRTTLDMWLLLRYSCCLEY